MADASDTLAGLVQSLDHSDKKVIRRAVDALVELAKTLPEVSVEVAATMARSPADKRWPMAYVLAQIAPPSDACCEALENALDADDPDIRWAVVVLLARLARAPDQPILSRLIQLAKRGTATQRRMALYALRDSGSSDERVPQAVRSALSDPDSLARVAALTSLKIFPEAGRAAVAEILRILESDPDARVRAAAALALAHSNAPDAAIRPSLERTAAGGDPLVGKAAQSALTLLNEKGPAPSD